jgi:hypothetical protein
MKATLAQLHDEVAQHIIPPDPTLTSIFFFRHLDERFNFIH